MALVVKGDKLAEGKTKMIWAVKGAPGICFVESKNDITAGDGAKHDVMTDKGSLANLTTCNVFRLLRRHGVKQAFIAQVNKTTFSAELCQMLPWEVVVRRLAWGSYLKRYPHIKQGHRFDPLLVEFFLKTSGKNWRGQALPEDDPYAEIFDSGDVCLYNPKLPFAGQQPFLIAHDVLGWERRNEIAIIAKQTFEILESAWASLGGRLIDFKVEFGINQPGDLALADVIDNDSWRVLDADGVDISKQAYRDGASLDDVTAKYRYVAELTSRFSST